MQIGSWPPCACDGYGHLTDALSARPENHPPNKILLKITLTCRRPTDRPSDRAPEPMHPTQDSFVRGVVFFSPLLAQKASNGDKQHPHNPLLLPLHPTSSTREGHTDEGKGGEPIDAGHSLTPRRRTKKRFTPHLSSSQPFFPGGRRCKQGVTSWVACAKPCSFGHSDPAGDGRCQGGVNKVRTASSLGGGAASDLTGPPTTSSLSAPSKSAPSQPPPPPHLPRRGTDATWLAREHVDLDLWAHGSGAVSGEGRSVTGPEAGRTTAVQSSPPSGTGGTGRGKGRWRESPRGGVMSCLPLLVAWEGGRRTAVMLPPSHTRGMSRRRKPGLYTLHRSKP